MKFLLGAALAAAALLSGPAAALAQAAPAPSAELAGPDAGLVSGRLPNGLRYLILPNRTPRQGVSIRLHVAAGSALETEAERGAAHFVEHMAFQGSRRFPGTSADARFAAAGVSTGRDQNAFTDVNGALYVFDIAQATGEKLDLAFAWMRDAMDALAFDPAALDRERGVVLQEIAVRRTGSTELGEAVQRFVTPGLLAASRSPGGTEASVRALDATALRAFHDRWYRPERTVLVVAGDVDAEAMRVRIAEAFGSWTAPQPPPVEPTPGAVDAARPLSVFAITTPNFAEGLVQVCRAAPRDPALPPGVALWRRDGPLAIWLQAIQLRLRRLARAADAPFTTASASRTQPYRQAGLTCLTASPKPGRWRDSLLVLAEEGRRLAVHGVTEGEVARARTELGAAIAASAAQAETRASSSLAASLLGGALEGAPTAAPAEMQRTLALAEPSLTAAAASDRFRGVWTAPGGPVIVVISTTPVTMAEVRDAWVAAQAKPAPAPPTDEVAVTWPYTSFGAPGALVARTAMSNPDFTRLEFRNGLRVNFKRTTFLRDRVDVRVSFGAGQKELTPSRQLAALVGVTTLSDGALGRLDAEALGRALSGKLWSLSLGVGRTEFTVAGATRPADLLTELQVVAAFLTDPGFRPDLERRIPLLADAADKTNRIEPLRAAQIALNASLPPPHVADPPSREAYAAVKASDVAAALRPALTTAPLEVTVVGDVDEAVVVDALSRTLGALPARAAAMRERPDAEVTRYPPAPPPPIRVTHQGLRDKAAVLAVWPLFVWEPARQREARALTLLREVLSEALRTEIRERLGITYTPSIGLSLERGGDQGSLSVAVQTGPEQAEAARLAVLAVAGRFARDGVTAAELEKVRKPLLDDTARRQEQNGWWLSTLDGSWAFPYKLEQQRTWLPDYTGLTAAEVGAAARRWLAAEPLTAVALPAPSPPASPPAVTPAPVASPTTSGARP